MLDADESVHVGESLGPLYVVGAPAEGRNLPFRAQVSEGLEHWRRSFHGVVTQVKEHEVETFLV